MATPATLFLVESDLLPFFDFKLEQEDDLGVVTPIDLSPFSAITLRVRKQEGTRFERLAVIDDAAEGEFHFVWLAGDLTEGIHDAELIEKVWGDDLREEAVVVEPLHGADDLLSAVTAFQPGLERRLGVLLDHLVEGSKESRIAASVSDPHVLIRGQLFVCAVKNVDVGY